MSINFPVANIEYNIYQLLSFSDEIELVKGPRGKNKMYWTWLDQFFSM